MSSRRMMAAIHAERLESPRMASKLAHSVGDRQIEDAVTVLPVGFRPAPSLAPPRVGLDFIPVRRFRFFLSLRAMRHGEMISLHSSQLLAPHRDTLLHSCLRRFRE